MAELEARDLEDLVFYIARAGIAFGDAATPDT